jgi:hypothetical protein
LIGDHNNPHLAEAKRLRGSPVLGDTTLMVLAFVVSAGLVVGLVVTFVVWVT